MNHDIIAIAFRVFFCCVVFGFFLFMPFKTKFRFNYAITTFIAAILILITVSITVLFLTSNQFWVQYNRFGIVLWFVSAMALFALAIKSNIYELIFVILVILNLYVNIIAIAKVALHIYTFGLPYQIELAIMVCCILIICIPLLYLLLIRLYQQVIVLQIDFSFWKYIWIIPTLTYMIFYVKIVNDYWKNGTYASMDDILFSVLWSVTTYTLYYVTLRMIIQTYKGMLAIEASHMIETQRMMQEVEYGKLLKNIENNAQLRHDWRHHMLAISNYVEKEEYEAMKAYIKELFPVYTKDEIGILCENRVVDIILKYNMTLAQEHNIEIEISADVPQNLSIQETDICIVFGNLIENALEACIRQNSQDKRIKIKTKMHGKQLVLIVENTYEDILKCEKGQYLSSKRNAIGIGLESVKNIVKKRNGIVQIQENNGIFSVSVLL